MTRVMKLSLLFIVLICICSCQSSTKLYNWYDYESTEYRFEKNADEVSYLNMVEEYEKIINEQDGIRGVVPPGIYADYGWLLIQNGKTDEGISMLMKEMEVYPESEVFIQVVLREFGIK